MWPYATASAYVLAGLFIYGVTVPLLDDATVHRPGRHTAWALACTFFWPALLAVVVGIYMSFIVDAAIEKAAGDL